MVRHWSGEVVHNWSGALVLTYCEAVFLNWSGAVVLQWFATGLGKWFLNGLGKWFSTSLGQWLSTGLGLLGLSQPGSHLSPIALRHPVPRSALSESCAPGDEDEPGAPAHTWSHSAHVAAAPRSSLHGELSRRTASSSLRVRSRSSRREIVEPWSFLCRSFIVSCGLSWMNFFPWIFREWVFVCLFSTAN